MQIRFVSRVIAQELDPLPGWRVISVNSPDEGPATLKQGWDDLLRLEFHDADPGSAISPLFDRGHAEKVLGFIRLADSEGANLLVHCYAGISRSAAIAIFAGELTGSKVFANSTPLLGPYGLYNRHVYRVLNSCAQGY